MLTKTKQKQKKKKKKTLNKKVYKILTNRNKLSGDMIGSYFPPNFGFNSIPGL